MTISNKVLYCCILKRSNKTENKREESSSFYSLRVTLYFQGQKAFKEDASKTRFERFPSKQNKKAKVRTNVETTRFRSERNRLYFG